MPARDDDRAHDMPEISLPGADDGGLRLHPSAGRGLRFGPPQDRHLLHHPGSLCVLPGPISGPSLGLDSVGGSGRGGRRAFLSEPSAAERPALRRPFVYVRKDMFKMEWDGRTLTLTFPVTPRDPEAVVLSFRPHHGYARLLDAWKAGKATMGEPTLTPNSISIPLKFPKVQPYSPRAVIGIDSNETNLTAYVAASGEMREIDTSYAARVSRDHERRARRGQRGKQNPRVRRKVAARHGRLRREKVATFWQGGALALMAWAASLGAALVLEDLKGMKGRLARQERRGLLNFWGVMTFHGVLASKAAFYGVPLLFVDPRDTSRSCPVCG